MRAQGSVVTPTLKMALQVGLDVASAEPSSQSALFLQSPIALAGLSVPLSDPMGRNCRDAGLILGVIHTGPVTTQRWPVCREPLPMAKLYLVVFEVTLHKVCLRHGRSPAPRHPAHPLHCGQRHVHLATELAF